MSHFFKYETLHKFVCHLYAGVMIIFSVLFYLYATCMYGFRNDYLVLDNWSSLRPNTSVPVFPQLPLVLCVGLRLQALPYPSMLAFLHLMLVTFYGFNFRHY